MYLRWSLWEPCEKLIRATSIPALSKPVITSGEELLGPIVQTISSYWINWFWKYRKPCLLPIIFVPILWQLSSFIRRDIQFLIPGNRIFICYFNELLKSIDRTDCKYFNLFLVSSIQSTPARCLFLPKILMLALAGYFDLLLEDFVIGTSTEQYPGNCRDFS